MHFKMLRNSAIYLFGTQTKNIHSKKKIIRTCEKFSDFKTTESLIQLKQNNDQNLIPENAIILGLLLIG